MRYFSLVFKYQNRFIVLVNHTNPDSQASQALVKDRQQCIMGIWKSLYSHINHLFCSTRPVTESQNLSVNVLESSGITKRPAKTCSPTGFHSQGHHSLSSHQHKAFAFFLPPLLSHKFRPKYFLFCCFLATANYNRELFRWGQSQKVQENKWKCCNGLKEKIRSKEHADPECYVSHPGDAFTVLTVWLCCFSALRGYRQRSVRKESRQ